MDKDDKLLAAEIKLFESRRAELVARDAGRYVLIYDDKVDVFASKADAIRHGYERFGNVPFLVRKIVPVDTALDLVSSLMGV
jgi:hypothetical protein